MKSLNIIRARVKRNELAELAGDFYRDENSVIVKELNERKKEALLGIQSDDGKYTIIGELHIYYKLNSTVEGEVSHTDFLKILKENAMKLGKMGKFETVNIDAQNAIWVLNAQVMNAIWNTLLLFE